jgi:hypothetical protein
MDLFGYVSDYRALNANSVDDKNRMRAIEEYMADIGYMVLTYKMIFISSPLTKTSGQ